MSLVAGGAKGVSLYTDIVLGGNKSDAWYKDFSKYFSSFSGFTSVKINSTITEKFANTQVTLLSLKSLVKHD